MDDILFKQKTIIKKYSALLFSIYQYNIWIQDHAELIKLLAIFLKPRIWLYILLL